MKVIVRVPSLLVAPSFTALEPLVAVITIVGTVVSMINALFAPNEFESPGLASVKVALFPAASRIVPLFKARELVAL